MALSRRAGRASHRLAGVDPEQGSAWRRIGGRRKLLFGHFERLTRM